MIIIYVIGFPFIVFWILYKNRKKLNNPEVLRHYLLLYQGVRHEKYYWELVNTFRKILLLILHVFISDKLRIIKALMGSSILFITSIVQAREKPYKIKIITSLEHREMISSMLTLYGGLIFVQEDNELLFLHIVTFALIVALNARFLFLWLFWVLWVYRKYTLIEKILNWMKKAFWIALNNV